MPLYISVDCRRTTINIFSHNENYHYNFNGKPWYLFIYLRFCKQMSDDIARLKAAPACYRACKATVNTLPPLPGNL